MNIVNFIEILEETILENCGDREDIFRDVKKIIAPLFEKKDCSIELISCIPDGVKSISYSSKKREWTVKYKSELSDDKVEEDNLLEHLENA